MTCVFTGGCRKRRLRLPSLLAGLPGGDGGRRRLLLLAGEAEAAWKDEGGLASSAAARLLRLPPPPGFASPRCTKLRKAGAFSNAASRDVQLFAPVQRASVDLNVFQSDFDTCVCDDLCRCARSHTPRRRLACTGSSKVLQAMGAAIVPAQQAHTRVESHSWRHPGRRRPQPIRGHVSGLHDAIWHTCMQCRLTEQPQWMLACRECANVGSASPARCSSVLGLRGPSPST